MNSYLWILFIFRIISLADSFQLQKLDLSILRSNRKIVLLQPPPNLAGGCVLLALGSRPCAEPRLPIPDHRREVWSRVSIHCTPSYFEVSQFHICHLRQHYYEVPCFELSDVRQCDNCCFCHNADSGHASWFRTSGKHGKDSAEYTHDPVPVKFDIPCSMIEWVTADVSPYYHFNFIKSVVIVISSGSIYIVIFLGRFCSEHKTQSAPKWVRLLSSSSISQYQLVAPADYVNSLSRHKAQDT